MSDAAGDRVRATVLTEAVSVLELARARELIVRDRGTMGGAPVSRGTRVPVHMIAEVIAQRATPAELIESYPRLTAEMIRCRGLPGAPAAPAQPAPARPQPGPFCAPPPY